MPSSVRVAFALNAGPKAGKTSSAASLVPPDGAALHAEAVKKLRLKKKEATAARLFVWSKDEGRGGIELPREGSVDGTLCNDDIVAVSFGEEYAGPCRAGKAAAAEASTSAAPTFMRAPEPSGSDDAGRRFDSLAALWADQAAHFEQYYAANKQWWDDDGYGGGSDEEAMIGDTGSEADVAHSLGLIDGLRASRPQWQPRCALDCGAGVGRVTKHVLLRRCERVTLVEPCERWLRQVREHRLEPG